MKTLTKNLKIAILTSGLLTFNVAMAGGVDGGGGTIGTTSILKTATIIQQAVNEFTGYNFLTKSPYLKMERLPLNERQLEIINAAKNASSKQLLGFLKESKVEIKTDGACLDNTSSPKDATIVQAIPHDPSICISAQRISRLPETAIYKEVLALLVHEISHAYGANEDEAVELQNLARFNMDVLYANSVVNPFTSPRIELVRSIKLAKMFLRPKTEASSLETNYNLMMAKNYIDQANYYLLVMTTNLPQHKKSFEQSSSSLNTVNDKLMASYLNEESVEDKNSLFSAVSTTLDQVDSKLQKTIFNKIILENF